MGFPFHAPRLTITKLRFRDCGLDEQEACLASLRRLLAPAAHAGFPYRAEKLAAGRLA